MLFWERDLHYIGRRGRKPHSVASMDAWDAAAPRRSVGCRAQSPRCGACRTSSCECRDASTDTGSKQGTTFLTELVPSRNREHAPAHSRFTQSWVQRHRGEFAGNGDPGGSRDTHGTHVGEDLTTFPNHQRTCTTARRSGIRGRLNSRQPRSRPWNPRTTQKRYRLRRAKTKAKTNKTGCLSVEMAVSSHCDLCDL